MSDGKVIVSVSKKLIVLICAAVLFLGACCAITFAVSALTPKQSPVPTVVKAVEIKPTNLPEPTATAVSMPTKAPLPTSDIVADYIDEVQARTIRCTTAINGFVAMNEMAAETPSIITSDIWLEQTEDYLDGIRGNCATMSEIGPVPAMFEESHKYMTLSDREYKLSVDLYWSGVKDLDPSKIQEAIEHLKSANTYIGLATDALPGR